MGAYDINDDAMRAFLPFKLTTLYEPKMRERYLQVMNGRIYVFEGLLFGSKILLLIAM